MGFLETIKRTFNISGTEITVVTEDDVYSQFDQVSGKVIIKGGEYKQSGNSIRLELQEFWTERRTSGKSTTTVTVHKTHESVTFADEFSVQPRSEQSYDFKVQLPMNCRISTKETGWCLLITMDIPRAVDPTEMFILKVEPAEEFMAIIHTCESDMRFQEVLRYRKWKKSTNVTSFRLIPPKVLLSELDYLRLELCQTENGSVRGSLVFDLQEKSVTDYFKAIFNMDQVEKSVNLAPDQIFLPDNQANTEAITQVIGKCLQEVISK